MEAKFAPAKRVAGQKQDVWSIVNEAAAASPKQPIGESSGSLRMTALISSSEYGTRLFVSMVRHGKFEQASSDLDSAATILHNSLLKLQKERSTE